MISIDTNVLLRYLLDDDSIQSPKAADLINSGTPILATDIVLVETIWTLKGKRYNLSRDEIAKVVSVLFEEKNIAFEDSQAVWRALADFRKARTVKVGRKSRQADFPDALIANKASAVIEGRGEKSEGTYTFDQAALELPLTRSL